MEQHEQDATEINFNLDSHLVGLMQDAPFFAELSRHIHKVKTNRIPTAGVSYDTKLDEIVLYWNPSFFSKLSAWEVRGVLVHEMYHLIFDHLTSRRKTPHKMWNIATDLAINSIIISSSKSPGSRKLDGDSPLPLSALVPGVFPKNRDGNDFTPEEKAAMKIATIIEKLPTMMASEWYFNKLQEESEKDKSEGGPGFGEENDCSPLDDHDGWDSLPDEVKEYVQGKVKSMVEKAVKTADSRSNGWGNVPVEVADAIRKSVSNFINWRIVLRQFIGSINRGGRTTSIKRINKRYPYIHPGVKRGYEAKLLIAIDQSGSVDNEMLADFFSELGSLTKTVTIDVIPFDTEALEKDLYTWKRGQNVPSKRVRGGGTDFNAPTRFANDPKNRGRWDGLLILSDGECYAPGPSRIKRGYVIGKGRKLQFTTDEIVVHMSDARQVSGAWR